MFWNQKSKVLVHSETNFKLSAVFNAIKPIAYLNYSALRNTTAINHPKKEKIKAVPKPEVRLPEKYVNLLEQKRYSENTISIYKSISLILSYISMIKIWQKFQKKLSITIS